MTLSDLQSRLASQHVVLMIREGRLVVDAPAGVLTAEIKAALTAHKTLLESLAAKSQTSLVSLPPIVDPAIVALIEAAFEPRTCSPDPYVEPDPAELIEVVDQCEAMGFELGVWVEAIERQGRAMEYCRRLSIRAAEGQGHPPRYLVLALMKHSRIVCGYVSRLDSPFFPDPASDADYRAAMEASISDDRRLREHNR
jgi:hypothetical protein